MRTKLLLIISICILFLTVSLMLSGPRVRGIDFVAEDAVMFPGQRLIVRINQQIETVESEDVSIVPDTRFAVTSSGDSVFIDFDYALKADTLYEVRLTNLKSSSTNRTSGDAFSFTTPSYDYIYLKRAVSMELDGATFSDGFYESSGDRRPDAVIRQTPSGKTEMLFEEYGLDELLVLKDALVVSKITDQQKHELLYVEKNGTRSVIDFADKISFIRKWGNHRQNFGYLARKELDGATKTKLFVYDVEAKIPFILDPFKDDDREIRFWSVSPDGLLVAVTDQMGQVYVFPSDDSAGVQYYGKFDYIVGFTSDSLSLLVRSGDATRKITLDNGDSSDLRMSESIDLLDGTSEFTPFNAGSGFVVKTGVYDEGIDRFATFVRLYQDGEASPLTQYDALTTSLDGVGITPNDQYVVLETSAFSGASYDEYLSRRASANIRTTIMDNSGTVLLSVDGFQLYATAHW